VRWAARHAVPRTGPGHLPASARTSAARRPSPRRWLDPGHRPARHNPPASRDGPTPPPPLQPRSRTQTPRRHHVRPPRPVPVPRRPVTPLHRTTRQPARLPRPATPPRVVLPLRPRIAIPVGHRRCRRSLLRLGEVDQRRRRPLPSRGQATTAGRSSTAHVAIRGRGPDEDRIQRPPQAGRLRRPISRAPSSPPVAGWPRASLPVARGVPASSPPLSPAPSGACDLLCSATMRRPSRRGDPFMINMWTVGVTVDNRGSP
jgi:hypothetical protein